MNSRGFTLIEMIIYLALFVSLSLLVVAALISLGRGLNTLRAGRGVTDATLVAFDRMNRVIQNAVSVDSGSSSLNAHPGRLVLDTGTQFFLSSTTLMIQESGGDQVPLVPPTVSFTNLIFRRIQTAGSEGVKIEATVGGKIFYSTAVLRGSY